MVRFVIFLGLMVLLTLTPYAMQRYDVVARHLAPLKPFVFGESGPAPDAGTREYISAWHGFSLSYPADWVEWPPLKPAQVLSVGPSGPAPYPRLTVIVMPLYLYSLKESSKVLASLLGTKARILHETSSRLEDGAPAREAELAWPEDGKEVNAVMLAAVRGHTLIMAHVSQTSGPADPDTRRILYSLKIHLSSSRQAG